MKKILLGLCLFLLAGGGMFAQSVVTIQQIQTPVNISACNDSSAYFGDTVTVRGVVVTNGGLAQAASGRNIWIKSGYGAYSGLDVYGSSTATTPDDVLNLIAGDSVEITGWIDNFNGESEIRPITVQIKGTKTPYPAEVVSVGDLNDNNQNNKLATGEPMEGNFIEIQNVTVVSVDYFSGGNRVSFIVQDASGNKMNVSDRFLAQRLPANGGTFVPPNVGDQFCYIRGIVAHSKNDDPAIAACTGNTGRGYELYPFDASHYSYCSAAPAISNITRNPITPTSTQTAQICATITDGDGIASATLYYAVGQGTMTYTSVSMTNTSGNTWCADIPAQADGSFVKYYICATDNNANSSCSPDVPGASDNPLFYFVRDLGTEIYDIQFTPYTNGKSGYIDLDVTVTGVVTASAEPGNLGYVYIQQENKLSWAGIMLTGSASLSTLNVGDKVTVTGTVKEYFNFTRLENVSNVTVNGTGNINPIVLSPDVFTTYDFAVNEEYEGMLVALANTGGGQIYVVDTNADAPSNFGEYRVGDDQFDPNTGTRVLAGRQSSSAFSSLNVSYVNGTQWQTTDGTMNVPLILVSQIQSLDTLKGVMLYSFSNFKITPRNNNDYVNLLTGVNNEVIAHNLQVYPNPAQGAVNVKYDFTSAMSDVNIHIYDMMGREVATTAVNGTNGEQAVDLANLPAGTYVLTLTAKEQGQFYHTKISVIK